jgi:hypothetical protein
MSNSTIRAVEIFAQPSQSGSVKQQNKLIHDKRSINKAESSILQNVLAGGIGYV